MWQQWKCNTMYVMWYQMCCLIHRVQQSLCIYVHVYINAMVSCHYTNANVKKWREFYRRIRSNVGVSRWDSSHLYVINVSDISHSPSHRHPSYVPLSSIELHAYIIHYTTQIHSHFHGSVLHVQQVFWLCHNDDYLCSYCTLSAY